MKPSDYKISLDILESQSQYSLPMKKGETARVVYITLREGGVPYEFGADCFAVLSGKKPDGNPLENNCVIKGNTIIYAITPQTTAVSGLVDCEIKLYGVDNGLVCSARFSIIVDKRVVGDEEVESSSEFSALTNLYAEARNAENERVVAEQTRVENENKRVSTFSDILKQGEDALKDVNEATDSANDIADTLQTKLDNGEFKGEKGDKGDTPENVANAIKNTVSGNPIVSHDVSPIPHTVKVVINGDKTTQLTACGKNIIPTPYYFSNQITEASAFAVQDDGGIVVKRGQTVATTFHLVKKDTFKLPKGKYTFSLKNGIKGSVYLVTGGGSDGLLPMQYSISRTVDIDETFDVGYLSIQVAANVDVKNLVVYPQLEIGEIETDYEQYKGKTYNLNADGACQVESISPCMSIYTETGESVECEYNRDTTAAIGDIESALDSIIAMQESLISGGEEDEEEMPQVRSEIELHNAGELWFTQSTIGNITKSNDGLAIVGYANTTSSSGNNVYVFFMIGETQNDVYASQGNILSIDYNGKSYYCYTVQYKTTQISNFGKCVKIPFNTSNEQTAKDLLDYYFMVE